MTMHDVPATNINTAVAALQRGYQAVPILDGGKRPYGSAWTHTRWDDEAAVTEAFARYPTLGASGVGLLLGEPSGGLIDVDLDHPKALRLRDHFLPPSPMQTGRVGRPRSHRWYRVESGTLPATRRYRMPDGATSVELRSTGAQTVIPPSVHPSREQYRWEGEPWGGQAGPSVVDGAVLASQVALLGMGAVLLENWPASGARHDAYLALAGGLLRFGHDGVHPFWERNLHVLIEALTDATHDEDGASTRVSEVMGSTVTRLRENDKAVGFPRLAELIGANHAEQVRRMAREVESLRGWSPAPIRRIDVGTGAGTVWDPSAGEDEALDSTLPPAVRNPMEERISSWAAVDLEPYLSGEVVMPAPSILTRDDGQALMYPGRVNSLFGMSESAKSWIALWACVQEMAKGERVLYIDFEDGPEGTLGRLMLLGAGADDINASFRYVHPEGPLADMQRYRYGPQTTEDGVVSTSVFTALLDAFDPTLVVADGMTVLYGLHGHDTNESTATEVIGGWLKRLCRSGRTTVIVIDHTGKGGGAGSSPIGSQHKVAMIQGTALRVDVVTRPMPGKVGEMRLLVFKDRPGAVRAISSSAQEQVAGVVTLDSTAPGITRITIVAAADDEVVIGDSAAMERRLAADAEKAEVRESILMMFGGDLDREISSRQVWDELGLTGDVTRDAWSGLVERGLVRTIGIGRGMRYMLVG